MQKPDRKAFLFGILTGLIASILLFFVLIWSLVTNGLTVEVRVNDAAGVVSREVTNEATRQLPIVIGQAKKEIPAQLAGKIQGLSDIRLNIASYSITLPEPIAAELKKQVERIAATVVAGALDRIDNKQIINRISALSYKVTKDTMQKELNGKTFKLQTSFGLKIPVTIKTR